jgi:glycosyltransferase involved in cell wall biosynthesis
MESAANSDPLISVVVTTYKRADILRRTLDHLSRQDLEPAKFEVIVSDDGSPDDTARVVKEFATLVPFAVRYLQLPNVSPGHAENRGMEAARAPIVLLMADDICMTPPAVRKHLEFHEARPEPTVSVLGKIVQSPDLTESAFLRKWDPFRFNELEDRDELPPYRFGAANLSVKRDFVLKHGGFLERRGRAGAAALEDLELGYRLEPHGLCLCYSKEALAHHYHPTTLDIAALRWYERGLNYGEFRRHAKNPELTVYFHVLTLRTAGEYASVLTAPNSFRGSERSFAWHVVRHVIRVVLLNRATAALFWRPIFALAEKYPWIEARLTPKTYRAFLYYHFLRGVREGRRIYGD